MTNRAASLRLQQLIEALTALAADAEAQTAWLRRYAVPTDELALNFDDAFWAVGPLPAKALAGCRTIDATLNGMSGPGSSRRWEPAALAGDAGWALVRRVAREVLDGLEREGVARMPEIEVIR
ncbi:hypothetical protein [Streptomyces sp. NPDC051211]|uniref:hypothetical protein n=1 Tax=Streptomyces sp. NPDC051211 TaxID=3154643 RepID=UPI003450EFB0